MDCSPEYVVDYYLDEMEGSKREKRSGSDRNVESFKKREFQPAHDQLFSNENKEQRTFERQEKIYEFEESFGSQFELPNQSVKSDSEVVIDERCSKEKTSSLDEFHDSQFQFKSELVQLSKQILTEQQETSIETLDSSESTLGISGLWNEPFESKNRIKSVTRPDLTTIYEQDQQNFESLLESSNQDKGKGDKENDSKNEKNILEEVEKDKEFSTSNIQHDKESHHEQTSNESKNVKGDLEKENKISSGGISHQIFVNDDSYLSPYEIEYQLDEETEQKCQDEVEDINTKFKKLTIQMILFKKREKQLKQDAENRWKRWIEHSTNSMQKELELSMELIPKLEEINSLSICPLPRPVLNDSNLSSWKDLEDNYRDYKESIISSMNEVKSKLDEANTSVQEDISAIDQKLSQLWRLFGRTELQEERDNLEDLQRYISDVTKIAVKHIRYLETYFKLPSE